MKAVILAGGMGTRISEESFLKPKPMVMVGGQPILWHIMKIYGAYGVHDFIICCGYKGHMIKDYFLDYAIFQSNIMKDLSNDTMSISKKSTEPWKVTLVNTGLHTKTAGRLLYVKDYIKDENFLLTYGDGVADINIDELIQFHRSHGKIATITVAKPEGRFGTMSLGKEHTISSFKEKNKENQGWVNAGFAVFRKDVFDYLGDGSQMLEQSPYEDMAEQGEMKAYCHQGLWAPMDTIHEREYLEGLWKSGQAFWKIW